MTGRVVLLAAAATLLGAGSAAAQDDDWRQCVNSGQRLTQDIAIGACTRVVDAAASTAADRAIALTNRGLARSRTGEHAAAIEDFNAALALDPAYANALGSRGGEYYLLGDFEHAMADLTAALAVRADTIDFDNRGLVYLHQDDLPRAIADFDAAIGLDPNNADALGNRAWAHYLRRAYVSAIADGDRALAIRRDPIDYNNRGLAYFALGNDARAISDFDQALALNARFAEPYYNRARAYERRGDQARALTDFGAAIDLEPQYFSARMYRGNIYFRANDNERAFADYDAAVGVEPSSAEALTNRGAVSMRMGNSDAAAADFEAAIRLDPNNATAYNNLGSLHRDFGRYEEAIANYDIAIGMMPNNPRWLENRCWARVLSARDLDLAMADCEATLRLQPDNRDARESRGFIHLRRGAFQEALADFEAVLAAQDLTRSLYGRGLAQIGLGRTSDGERDIAAARARAPEVVADLERNGFAPLVR